MVMNSHVSSKMHFQKDVNIYRLKVDSGAVGSMFFLGGGPRAVLSVLFRQTPTPSEEKIFRTTTF
jgi:hypothetical protein